MKNPNHKTYNYKQFVGCTSKVGYKTVKEAKEGAKRLSYRFGNMVSVHAYACRFCGKYHLTTSEKNYGGKFNDRIF